MRYETQPSFELGPEITQEQLDFFDQHGFIHFRNVASDEEVDSIIQAMDEMEHQSTFKTVRPVCALSHSHA